MLSLAFALLLGGPSTLVERLDDLAQKRDVEALLDFAGPSLGRDPNPFQFLKTNGVFGSGRSGWRVLPLDDATGKYVVFSTEFRVEDLSDQIFLVQGDKLGGKVPETNALGFRVRHHRFDVAFDIPNRSVRIRDRLTIERFGPARAAFFMRIGRQFKVTSMTDAAGKAIAFRQVGGALSVPAPKEQRFDIVLDYSATFPEGARGAGIKPNEAMLTDLVWWPSIARNAATYEATILAPADWVAIAQGERTSSVDTPQGRRTSYRMDLPSCVFSLCAGKYEVVSKIVAGRRYTIFSLQPALEANELQCELFARVFAFFERIHPYPFKEWGCVITPSHPGGALEAYSFATYTTGWLPDEEPHEPAHTWWGGIVPNTYLRSLWNESFASFCEGFYRREGGPGNREERRRAYVSDARPSPQFDALACAVAGAETGSVAGGLGYGKGAYVLQVLEAEIGPERMLEAMSAWCKEHKRGEVGEWEDFERIVSRVAGRSLAPFFDYWIRGTGWLRFESATARWTPGQVEIVLQAKEGHRLLADGIEVMLEMPGGERTFVRPEVVGSRGPSPTLTLRVPVTAQPALVSIDPWRKLLRDVEREEAPPDIAAGMRGAPRWIQPGYESQAERLIGRSGPNQRVTDYPEEVDGKVLVGDPTTDPRLAALLADSGIRVARDTLRFDGTTVPLDKGGAIALVNLPSGGRCVVAVGNPRLRPKLGRARTILFDEYGGMVRGATEPKTRGSLTVRL